MTYSNSLIADLTKEAVRLKNRLKHLIYQYWNSKDRTLKSRLIKESIYINERLKEIKNISIIINKNKLPNLSNNLLQEVCNRKLSILSTI
tara:strand:+ start:1446 stop:1715 length:270 start_codon:yes stop_codon:yes gene_type:complete